MEPRLVYALFAVAGLGVVGATAAGLALVTAWGPGSGECHLHDLAYATVAPAEDSVVTEPRGDRWHAARSVAYLLPAAAAGEVRACTEAGAGSR